MLLAGTPTTGWMELFIDGGGDANNSKGILMLNLKRQHYFQAATLSAICHLMKQCLPSRLTAEITSKQSPTR